MTITDLKPDSVRSLLSSRVLRRLAITLVPGLLALALISTLMVIKDHQSREAQMFAASTAMLALISAIISLAYINRKHVEEALIAQTEWLSVTLRSMGEGVIVADMDGRVTLINRIAEFLTGWSEAEASGKLASEVFDVIRESNDYADGAVERAILVSRDGTHKDIAANFAPIRGAAGGTIGVIFMFRDNTGQKAAEEALHKSEARYRSLWSAMSEGLCLHEIVTDDNGVPVDYQILEVNQSYERITGLSSSSVTGRLASEVYGVDYPPYLQTYASVAQTGLPQSFDCFFAPMDKLFHVSVFSPAPGQFATVFSDISERGSKAA